MRTKRYHLSKSGDLEIEFVPGETLEAYDALAREALGESRASLLMAARFLSPALWRLPLVREPLRHTLAAGADCMQYDPERVVERFREDGNELVRDCLHALLHCLFHHPFERRFKEADTWSLACDVSVEIAAIELVGSRFASELDCERIAAARRLSKLARNLTAPALYQLFRHGGPGEQRYLAGGLSGRDLDELRALFVRDSHAMWLNTPADRQEGSAEKARIPDLQASGPVPDEPSENQGARGEGSEQGDASGESREENPTGEAAGETHAGEGLGEDGRGAPEDAGLGQAGKPQELDPCDEDAGAKALEEWRRVSKQVETELRMQRRMGMSKDGSLLISLSVANKNPADYDSFLKRFATLAEDIRVNDDEFDYVFYTYGLNRYGNMPLVEPLEYVESSRVREFVIALDTSGSCSGELIYAFVQRTFDILRQRTSFGDDINVHIVQCDKEIRSATKISSLRQLEEYRDAFWVSGGGGTDFKPVFEYVDKLVEEGEFNDLRGLVYFTDGYGAFPVRAPDYEVAFVFVDVEGLDVRVPPWAMKVVMSEGEILEPQ